MRIDRSRPRVSGDAKEQMGACAEKRDLLPRRLGDIALIPTEPLRADGGRAAMRCAATDLSPVGTQAP